jgi:hypothetical protein
MLGGFHPLVKNQHWFSARFSRRNDQWEPKSQLLKKPDWNFSLELKTIWWKQFNENCLGFHLMVNLRIESVFTFWEEFVVQNIK